MAAPGIVPTQQGTLVYPGNQGGTNWYNPSFSPATGLFYIPAWENSSSTYVKGEQPPEFHEGQSFTGAFPRGGATNDDVYSAIVAMDPKTGDKKWSFRLSAPSTEGGVLTTASNVLFTGGRDGQFVALDARDGKLLWETNLGPSVSAGPMSIRSTANSTSAYRRATRCSRSGCGKRDRDLRCDPLGGYRSQQDSVAIVAIGQPDVRSVHATDVRIAGNRTRPESDPALHRRCMLERRE